MGTFYHDFLDRKLTNMQNKNYSQTFGISQSMIKDFQFKSPKKWKSIWIDNQEDTSKKESTFIFGSLVDTLLFTPEELENRFYIGEFTPPSKAIEDIVTNVAEMINRRNIENSRLMEQMYPEPIVEIPMDLDHKSVDDLILHCADHYEDDNGKKGWNIKWKVDTRLAKIRDAGREYFQHLRKADGRKEFHKL